ncbi:hypothetical protein R1sor_016866 [Riccia sorocarpa]|uniref:Uncharacterized protein n=1 Tax=Riccia sorocarpa TaxID=122646 RepID=A0ABD3HGA6_9MARC
MRLMKKNGVSSGRDSNDGDGQRISLEAHLAMKGTYLTTEETDAVESFDRAFLPSLARAITLQERNWWVSHCPPGRIIEEIQQELQIIRMLKSGNDDWDQSLQAAAVSMKEWHETLNRRRHENANSLEGSEGEQRDREETETTNQDGWTPGGSNRREHEDIIWEIDREREIQELDLRVLAASLDEEHHARDIWGREQRTEEHLEETNR